MSDRINVIRAPRDSEHAYLAISRALTQDRRLSFEARGVLAYLLSKPSDWVVRIPDLQKEGNCGRDRIYRILKELRDAGYLHRDQEHQPNGAFAWGPYRVYEQPFTDKADMVAQHQEATQPFTENTDTVKPDTANTEMVKRGKRHQEATQPFTPLPYTENTDTYIIESNTDQRILQKRERETPAPAVYQNPAVVSYTNLTGRTPNRTSAEMIASQVKDTAKWEAEIGRWLASDFKPGNVVGMLDWYHGKGKHQTARAIVAPHVPTYELATDTRTELSADQRRAIMARRKDT
jgi:predicted transcriptional regulator